MRRTIIGYPTRYIVNLSVCIQRLHTGQVAVESTLVVPHRRESVIVFILFIFKLSLSLPLPSGMRNAIEILLIDIGLR